MEKWFELEVIFFDMIFAFCRSAAFVEAQASHSTVIPCGKGRGRGQQPSFTGTISLGFAVSGCAGSNQNKEILLERTFQQQEECLISMRNRLLAGQPMIFSKFSFVFPCAPKPLQVQGFGAFWNTKSNLAYFSAGSDFRLLLYANFM